MRNLCAAALLLLAACSAPQITGSPSYTLLTPKGDIGLATAGTPVADTKLSTLGIEDEEGVLGARFDFKWGMPHLSIATQSTGWKGNGTLDVDFGGISAGEAVSSELDLALHRAYLTFDFAPTDYLELGVGVGAMVVDLKAKVTANSGAFAPEEVDELIPLPVLAGRAGGRLWKLDLEAIAAGVKVDIDGDEATFLDLDLNAKYALFGEHGSFHGALVAGWRTTSFAVAYEDDFDNVDLDATFSGPYIGLQLGF